jgi:hypothetical protein
MSKCAGHKFGVPSTNFRRRVPGAAVSHGAYEGESQIAVDSCPFAPYFLSLGAGFKSLRFYGETTVANKDQNKGKAKNNAPKLTAKQKKEKRAKKEAAKRTQNA